METVELVLRAGGGLAAVLGCVWLVARLARGRLGAPSPGTLRLRLLQRLPVGRRSAVVVVDAGDEVLVLGVSDASVALLTTRVAGAVPPDQQAATDDGERAGRAQQAGPSELAERAEPGEGGPPVPRPRPRASPRSQALVGSVLDPQTWRQAVDAARERTVRR